MSGVKKSKEEKDAGCDNSCGGFGNHAVADTAGNSYNGGAFDAYCGETETVGNCAVHPLCERAGIVRGV